MTVSHVEVLVEEPSMEAALQTLLPAADPKTVRVIPRIAVEELEAWFFGDWQAVRAAYPGVAAGVPSKRGHRDADAIAGGTAEALERVLQDAGYFAGGLRKIEAARAIATHMDPRRNRSKSFCVLRDALAELVA